MNASLLSSEDGIGSAVQGSGMGIPTLQERGIGDAQQFLRQDMMSSGSPNARGFDTSRSDSVMRDVGEGMGEGLDRVMRMTQGIQSKYGNPDDKSVDQIINEFNVNEAENAFQGTDNNRTFLQKTGDALDNRYGGVMDALYNPDAPEGGSGFYNSIMGYPMRLVAGADVSEEAIAAHRANKILDTPFWSDGTGLAGYKHQNLKEADGSTYIPVSDATDGYHFRSGKDAGLLSGNNVLPGSGIPMAIAGHAYQQAAGLGDSSLFDVGKPIMDTFNNKTNNTRAAWNDIPGQLKEAGQFISSIPSGFETAIKNPLGTFGTNAYLQAVDNARGLAASGNAPAVQGIFDRIDLGAARDEVIKQRIADGTFVPFKKGPSYDEPKQTVADRKGYTPEPAAKPRVKVDYNKNKPVAVKKTKPTPRGPQPVKVTRTTGSRGGRGNVGARRRLTGGR